MCSIRKIASVEKKICFLRRNYDEVVKKRAGNPGAYKLGVFG